MKFLVFSFCLLLVATTSFAQTVIGVDPVSTKNVKQWPTTSSAGYAGSYHFGFSEGESTFNLKIKNGLANASQEYTAFSGEGEATKLRQATKKFTHVRIVGSKFYSDQTNGEFVIVTEGNKKYHGLKVYKPWSGTTPKGSMEIGLRN